MQYSQFFIDKAKKETIEEGEAFLSSLQAITQMFDLTTDDGRKQAHDLLDLTGEVQKILKRLDSETSVTIWFETQTMKAQQCFYYSGETKVVDIRGQVAIGTNGLIGLGYSYDSDIEGYVISHTPSGMRVGRGKTGFTEEKAAQNCIRDLAPLCDWTMDVEQLRANKQVVEKAFHIYEEYLIEDAANTAMGGTV